MNEINRKLLQAVEYGKVETVRDLLNQYGIGASEANGYVLLRKSVSSGSRCRKITELLLVNGAKANSKRNETHPSHTPLHYAVGRGDIETVELLLNYNADINLANERRVTPLMLAITIGNEKIIDILFDRGAYVSASCIHLAVQNRQITEKLLQLGISANCTDYSNQQFTPLLSAAQYVENSSVVELLLKHGANVNAVSTEGQTALHLASKRGHVETMKVLLRSNADVNARCKDMLTPLYLAVHASQTEAAKLLMNYGADINFEFKTQETILSLAVSKGLSLIVKEVLKYSPDKNNASNKSVLAIAANKLEDNYLEIVQDLMKYGFSVDQNDVVDLIRRAIKASYINILQHIFDHGLHLLCYEDANCNFLHIAVQCKNVEIVELFLTHGFNVDATDKLGKRALYYSVKNSDVVMTKLLLSHGASVQKSPELLRIATKNICKDLVEILLQNKADIDAIDEHGRTALHLNASQNLFLSLIELSYSVNNFGTKAEMAKMLLSMGANVDAKTKDKNLTALHIACSQTNPDVVEVLLEYKANVNCLVGDVSPLMIAAKRGNASIMKMLIANGASVNLKRNNGDSVLHILARTSHTDALKVLLENDADVYSTNSEGQTPLHYASCNPNDEIASLLLQNMSHSDLKDNEGRTPLVLAVKSCHTSIVKLLLDFGSDINVVLNDNYTLFKITQNVRTPQMYISDDEDNDYYVDRYCYNTKYFAIINVLKKHTIKLRIAGLYVSKRNINFLSYNEEFDDFFFDCESEINKIKQEKIANNKISLYDILTKNTHSLANYARNADVIQYFNSENYKTKFVIYAPFIERNFKNGYRRRLLLEQGHMFFKCYLKLPIDCSELILTYLSDADLENIINIVSKMP